MSRLAASFIVLIATVGSASARAQMPTLAELEARLDHSAAMQIVDGQLDIARMRLETERRRQGASLYSHTSFSDNDEVVDVGRSRSYRQLSAGAGVRVPVLGSRMQWRASVSKYELQLARYESERELRKRELLKELRTAYANYWAAQQVAVLTDRYLDDEPDVARALVLRTKAGLLLEADRQESMSGFVLARRDQTVAYSDRQRALDTIRMLVNGPVEEGIALRPASAPDCVPSDERIGAWVERSPEVQFLRQVMLKSESSLKDSAIFPVNAEIRAGYQRSTEWPAEQHGGSAAVTLTFDVPINFMSQHRLQKASAAAERSQARLEYELRRAEEEQQLRDLIRRRAVVLQALQFAAARKSASDEAVRERGLRAAKLAGDVIEQLQQARLARYVAAKQVVDAELALALWSAEWALHAPVQCRPRGLYVWSSAPLLAQLGKGASVPALDQAAASPITNLLVSLDPRQIEQYRKDPEGLRAALHAAHERGLKVELLLGEPSWILPQHRQQLLDIVKSFAALPFDGIHLDLEPNQLEHTGIAEETLLQGLVDSLRAVRAISSLPVELSLHPRYLTRQVGGRTMGEHLDALDVGVTLMIYVANPARVVEIAEPLLSRYPSLPVRIALSVEATLGRQESLYHLDPAERARRIEMIEAELESRNFRGITLQPAVGAIRAALVLED